MEIPKCYEFNEFLLNLNLSDETFINKTLVEETVKDNELSFGTLTLLIVVLINLNIVYEINNNGFILKLKLNLTPKTLSRLIALTILFALLPVILVILLLVLIYKIVCSFIIKNKDKYFVKFLDTSDVFWCLEDNKSESLINVVGIIEARSAETLLNDIKCKLIKIIKENNDVGVEKIFYRKKEQFGFYYWRKYSVVDMEEYVQTVEHPWKNELSKNDLEEIMTDLSTKALPYNNEGLFQILITKHRLNTGFNNGKGDYGIIFRIHHAVGDGVALIDFLCKTLADENKITNANMFSFPTKERNKSFRDLIEISRKLCEMPISFVDGIIREPDVNSLHGPELTGTKIYKWIDSGEELMQMIKEIKFKLPSVCFSEIIVTALSKGLRDYFSKTMPNIPETVAVVLPVRFPKYSNKDMGLKLKNDFSVTILDLPINFGHISKVKSKCDGLRNSSDPLANYYFLKIVSYVLPKAMLGPLLHSSQATMVFSNMPGPDMLRICGGNLLKSLVFFIPQKGTTGVGVTALCYGRVLRLGISIDSALIRTEIEPSLILDAMVEEIKRMHQEYVGC